MNNLGALQLSNTKIEIFQFSLGYRETIQGKKGVTQFDIRGRYSPGNFNNHNSDANFQRTRLLSSSDYFYALGSIEHQRRLREDWSLRAKITGQAANQNLQPSEQLGAGGYDTVRGFDQRVARGDNGFWSTVELTLPDHWVVPSTGKTRRIACASSVSLMQQIWVM